MKWCARKNRPRHVLTRPSLNWLPARDTCPHLLPFLSSRRTFLVSILVHPVAALKKRSNIEPFHVGSKRQHFIIIVFKRLISSYSFGALVCVDRRVGGKADTWTLVSPPTLPSSNQTLILRLLHTSPKVVQLVWSYKAQWWDLGGKWKITKQFTWW